MWPKKHLKIQAQQSSMIFVDVSLYVIEILTCYQFKSFGRIWEILYFAECRTYEGTFKML